MVLYLFNIVLISGILLQICSVLIILSQIAFQYPRSNEAADPVIRLSAIVMAISILMYTVAVRHIPCSSLPEAAALLSCALLALLCRLPKALRTTFFPGGGALILSLISSSALLFSGAVPGAINPILHPGWLILHVMPALAAEAALLVGSLSGLARGLLMAAPESAPYLAAWPMLRLAERRLVIGGWGLFTVFGLIMGMIWASQAWGRPWGWDLKECCALGTWLIYSVYAFLLLRFPDSRFTPVFAGFGLIAMLFTLLISLYPDSIHGY